MNAISFQSVVELNESLMPLGYRISLQDSCGGQILSIRTLAGEKSRAPEEVYRIIADCLECEGVNYTYNDAMTSLLISG